MAGDGRGQGAGKVPGNDSKVLVSSFAYDVATVQGAYRGRLKAVVIVGDKICVLQAGGRGCDLGQDTFQRAGRSCSS